MTLTYEPSMAPRRNPSIALPEHVHRVTSKGRDYYYLHVRRGTDKEQPPCRLPDDPRLPEWWDEYRRLLGLPAPVLPRNAVARLIEAYRGSPEWLQCKPKTKKEWGRYHDRIEAAWGPLEVRGIEPRHVLALRDKYAGTPAAANNLLRCLSAFISWSVPRGWRADNPCRHVRQLKGGEGYKPWPWQMIELARHDLRPDLWHAAAVALYTGQRRGDCLVMRWDAIHGNVLAVRQEKTGKSLVIPLHRDLRAVLETIEKCSVMILTSTAGTPWTADGFKASWGRNLPAPIRAAKLVFHGLRKSAVVMLLEAGCSDAEVAAITGQSREMVEHYAKMVNQQKLAAAAILKWERARNG